MEGGKGGCLDVGSSALKNARENVPNDIFRSLLKHCLIRILCMPAKKNSREKGMLSFVEQCAPQTKYKEKEVKSDKNHTVEVN